MSNVCSDVLRRDNKNKAEEDAEKILKNSAWHELEIRGNVCSISPRLWEMTGLTVLYLHNNRLRSISSSIANLVNLVYLDISNNLLEALPPEVGSLSLLRVLHLYNNHLQTLPLEMGLLHRLNTLTLSGNPLDLDIITIYADVDGTVKLLQYFHRKLMDRDKVYRPGFSHLGQYPRLPQRPWMRLCRPAITSFIFTIMSYNILCERYANKKLFGYCPRWALSWNYRKRYIMSELVNYSADIITLQELETEQFETTFSRILDKYDYKGIFIPKSRVRTMEPLERRRVDGCAIFYRTTKFRLLRKHIVEFNQISFTLDNDSCNIVNRVKTKDNVALAALLETCNGTKDDLFQYPEVKKQLLLVCTVHIHWDPANCDVKIVQTLMLLNELRKFLKRSLEEIDLSYYDVDKDHVPVIISGDFNSLPNSGVIELLLEGKLSMNHQDFLAIPYGMSLKQFSSSDSNDSVTHDFQMSTAYENYLPFTNYTLEFKGIIDYILFTQKTLRVLGLLGSLDKSWIIENRLVGCPHPCLPSDHIPLVAEFEMIRPSSTLSK